MKDRLFPWGSWQWLMLHEYRLFLLGLAATMQGCIGRSHQRTFSWAGLWWLPLLMLTLHVMAWGLLQQTPLLADVAPRMLRLYAGAAMLASFSLMVASGLARCAILLGERRDWDLLLTSPVSSRAVFSARLGGLILGVSSLALLLLGPVANMGLLGGTPRLMFIYPTILAMASCAGSLSMLLSIIMFERFNARTLSILAQVVAGITIGAIFYGPDLYDMLEVNTRLRLEAYFGSDALPGALGVVGLPVNALLGDPVALLGLSVLAALSSYVACQCLHRSFVRVALRPQIASGRIAVSPFFRAGPWLAVVLKEWRLLRRDTLLIARLGMNVVLVILIVVSAVMQGSASNSLAPAIVQYLAGMMLGNLLRSIQNNETALALLQCAPLQCGLIQWGKFAAAAGPVLLFAVPMQWWLLGEHPGLVALAIAFLAAALLMVGALNRPFRQQTAAPDGQLSHSPALLLGEILLNVGWAIGVMVITPA